MAELAEVAYDFSLAMRCHAFSCSVILSTDSVKVIVRKGPRDR